MVGFFFLLRGGSLCGGTLLADGLGVVGLIPLPERGSVDLNDGALHQGVGADELIVGCVVNNTDKPSLSCDMLRCPCEVTCVKTEGTVLGVTTTDAHSVNTLGTKLGASRLTTELEFSLLAIVGALGRKTILIQR